jgi:hypothetical protein
MKEPSIEEQVNKTVTDITELYAGWYANSTTLGELSDSIKAILQSERRKAAIEILLRIRDKADFMRGAGMELNIESTIWNELEVLDPSLNDKRIAELESNTEKEERDERD